MYYFLFPAYYHITKSPEKSVQFDTDEEMQMDLLIFMPGLKLSSEPRLHHFFLVIWKLPGNRFPDFLSIDAHHSNPLSRSSDTEEYEIRKRDWLLQRNMSLQFLAFGLFHEKEGNETMDLKKNFFFFWGGALFLSSFPQCLNYIPLEYNKLSPLSVVKGFYYRVDRGARVIVLNVVVSNWARIERCWKCKLHTSLLQVDNISFIVFWCWLHWDGNILDLLGYI